MNSKPESFAAIDREWQAANDEMTRLQASIEQLSKEKRRVEGELSDQQEILKRYQGNLMQVKNQQQYAAAWKEIDSTRKQVKDLEDADLKTMGDIESLQTNLNERRDGSTDLKSRWDAAHAEWQHSLGDLRAEVAKLKERASALESQLPDRLKNDFFRIFKQRQNVAVAAVTGETCSACRTRIRPALYQQLKRGELVHCEGCHRILYLERPQS
ncbi:MAG TPA: C4-type zinc ribbon domain-containing protein [Thermoanaerobaculia bacterium]|nr:C4-type zinc ribbon domain-containing protein [Thermoanaerobaculia bacterium]